MSGGTTSRGSEHDRLKKELEDCAASAKYWMKVLPDWTREQNKRANYFEISSALLAALTGAGLWLTVIAGSTAIWAQAVAGIAALVAAALEVIPKTLHYRDHALGAAPLPAEYGAAKTDIAIALDALDDPGNTEAMDLATKASDRFHAVKKKKDDLYPDKDRRLREQGRLLPAVGGA